MSEWRADPVTGRWVVIAADEPLRRRDFDLDPVDPDRRGLLPAVRGRGSSGRPRDRRGARRHARRTARAGGCGSCPTACRRCGSRARSTIAARALRAHARPRRARGRRRDAAARRHLGDDAGRRPGAGARRLARPDGRPAARLADAGRAGLQERGRQGRGAAGASALAGGGDAGGAAAGWPRRWPGRDRYYEASGRCVYCALVDQELAAGSRVVASTADAAGARAVRRPLAVRDVAPAAGPPGAVRAGARHRCSPPSPPTLQPVLQTHRAAARAPGAERRAALGARTRRRDDAVYHWHLEIVPRVLRASGFDLGSGTAINPVSPEEAARVLRS